MDESSTILGRAQSKEQLRAPSSSGASTTVSDPPAGAACSAPSPVPAPCNAGRRWKPGFASGLRGRVLNFTPSWFSVVMGTGISSIILHNLSYQFKGLNVIATIMFVLNVVLFFVFLLVSIARYAIWPKVWTLMLNHNVQSLFLGTFAMGFATIGDGIVLFCVPAFGERFVTLAWACWWIDSVISMVVCIGMPFLMFTKQEHAISNVTGVWLLPVVSPIVAAAAGGIVATVLPPTHARITVIISYIMLGAGLIPSGLIMALYFQRLAVYKVPPSSTIVSVFLPVGPCGQSAFAFLQLASVVRQLQTDTGVGLGGGNTSLTLGQHEIISYSIYGLSLITAMFMIGLGFFWLIIAIATCLRMSMHGGFPFNMGWWGFTFPIGTMATATTLLAKELDSEGFQVLGMMLSVSVVLLWLYVAARTAFEAFRGTVFVAPCLGVDGKAPVRGEKGAKGEKNPVVPVAA